METVMFFVIPLIGILNVRDASIVAMIDCLVSITTSTSSKIWSIPEQNTFRKARTSYLQFYEAFCSPSLTPHGYYSEMILQSKSVFVWVYRYRLQGVIKYFYSLGIELDGTIVGWDIVLKF